MKGKEQSERECMCVACCLNDEMVTLNTTRHHTHKRGTPVTDHTHVMPHRNRCAFTHVFASHGVKNINWNLLWCWESVNLCFAELWLRCEGRRLRLCAVPAGEILQREIWDLPTPQGLWRPVQGHGASRRHGRERRGVWTLFTGVNVTKAHPTVWTCDNEISPL